MEVGGAYRWAHKIEGLNPTWFLFSLWSSTHLLEFDPMICNYCLKHVTWVMLKVICQGVVWFDTKYWMLGMNMPRVIPTSDKTMSYPNVGLSFWHSKLWTRQHHMESAKKNWRSKNTSNISSGSNLIACTHKTWWMHMLKSLIRLKSWYWIWF